MEKVTNGKYVELAYELSELDGTKEETMLVMTKEHPECIVFGVEQNVLPALLNALEGKTVGDTFDTVIEPKDAFGEFNEKLLMTLERELFERDGKFDSEHVHNGAIITMMTMTSAVATMRTRRTRTSRHVRTSTSRSLSERRRTSAYLAATTSSRRRPGGAWSVPTCATSAWTSAPTGPTWPST